MKKLLLFPLFLGGFLFSQTKEDSVQFKKISDEILVNGTAYKNLTELCKNIGNRLSGSKNYDNAVIWAKQKLEEAGADKVWLQEVTVPYWIRGKEFLEFKTQNGKWKKIKMLSLGNSEGTKGKDLTGEIILVHNYDEFAKLPDSLVKNKIVFFNYPFNQTFITTGQAYGDAVKYRSFSASVAGKKGAKAVIIRSLSSNFDDVPHTGNIRYDEKDSLKIPAVAIGVKTAEELDKILKTQKVYAKLNSNCGMHGEKATHQVIGEITGKKDNSVIVVGGHLDSWDVGEGASDDGTGIVQSIEVIRTFKKLGIANNHNIRVVCFANEENGVKGGTQYAKIAKETQEKHLFALESDAGGFTPRGFGLVMDDAKKNQIKSWAALFYPYGIYDFTRQSSGTDINPLKELGTPLSGLIPDSQRYFDIHHTVEDNLDKVNAREMFLGAVGMTQLIYMIDKNW